MFASAYLAAYAVRFEGVAERWSLALATMPLVVALRLIALLANWHDRSRWPDATFAGALDAARPVALGSLLVASTCALGGDRLPIPRSILVIDWVLATTMLIGLHGVARAARERGLASFGSVRPRRVLVVGRSEVGEVYAREIRRRPELGMYVVGFLDPDRASHSRIFGRADAANSPDHLTNLVRRHRADLVLIPEGERPPAEVRALVAACHALGVRSRILPAIGNLLTGPPRVSTGGVDLDSLLRRETITLDDAALGSLLEGRVVLVTGAAGSIGSEIARLVLAQGPRRLVLLDNSENGLFFIERELRECAAAVAVEIVPCLVSIGDPRRLRDVFERHRPEVVLHAAAYKHVPMLESHPGEAVKNIVMGTRNLVDAAMGAGVDAFVMISTDKAVRPSSVMGACKRLAEMYVQAMAATSPTRLVTVRFGNVLGSSGSVVPIFLDQIRRGGPLTITHPEMTRYFMTIPEAARLVLQAAALGKGGEIFVLDMGGPIKILDLARSLIRLSGLVEGQDVQIAYTGLRPGEKLHEELYDHGEERLPTAHRKIFRTRHRPIAAGRIRADIEWLGRLAEGDEEDVLGALAQLVPGYRPERMESGPTELGEALDVENIRQAAVREFNGAAR